MYTQSIQPATCGPAWVHLEARDGLMSSANGPFSPKPIARQWGWHR